MNRVAGIALGFLAPGCRSKGHRVDLSHLVLAGPAPRSWVFLPIFLGCLAAAFPFLMFSRG